MNYDDDQGQAIREATLVNTLDGSEVTLRHLPLWNEVRISEGDHHIDIKHGELISALSKMGLVKIDTSALEALVVRDESLGILVKDGVRGGWCDWMGYRHQDKHLTLATLEVITPSRKDLEAQAS